MKLKNSVVLITGGAGNIGSYIVDEVISSGTKEIVVVDNFFNSDKQYLENKNVIVYPIDISSLEEMTFVFEKHKPDYVFHCASMLIQDSETLPRKSMNTNIVGTFNVVDLSNKFGVKKICYSSSASVYGEPKYLPVDEDHPFQYDNFVYGWTKITAELILRSECKCDWLGFRYYNVYSDRMRQGAFYTQVFPIFYNKIKNGEPITIYGDGSQTMDLIHAEDIARANILGLESDVSGEFFNVGSGKETSVLELAKLMMEMMDTEVEINIVPQDSQKVKNRRSSIDKINQLISFSPTKTVKEGLTQYLQTIKNNDN